MGEIQIKKTADERIARLRRLMGERGIDAYLIPTSDYHESEYVGEYFKCRQFLTGFSGSAGTVVVTMEEAGLWTDGRYFVQAENQLEGTCVELYRMGNPGTPEIEAFLCSRLPEGGCLGFDGRVVNDEMGRKLSAALADKKVSVSYEEDLVGMVWEDRPALSCRPIWILEERYAGRSFADKIESLREEMAKKKADVHILTALDEIAWLLNLRGDDILCNPVFLSYALITREHFLLFVQEKAVSGEVRRELEKNGVELCSYGALFEEIASLRGQTILLERKKVSYSVCESIGADNRIIDNMNPCAVMKVVKNETEIENMKKAHLKDGIAVTKFMYWLKKEMEKASAIPGMEEEAPREAELTEMTAARKIEELRAAQGGYLGPSFITIAAYRENAAMCHYHPSDEVCSPLKPKGLLLVDSGGQYYEGTTDITRTFALGPLTEKEKEYYTIVSMSMLKAGDMKFLHGCSGLNLDYTIREAFWQRGLDFNHGTGHGVGYLSAVHERPNGIRWKIVPERQDSAVIEPGMICSDEPGLYFEGEFGVRTENMILCVPDEKNQYGQFLRFEFLTWAPIDLDAIDTNYMDEHDVERLNRYHREVFKRIAPYLSEKEAGWLREATREVVRQEKR